MKIVLDVCDEIGTQICNEADRQGMLVEHFCLRAIKDRMVLRQVQESIHVANISSAQITLEELTAITGYFNEAKRGNSQQASS